MLEYLFQIGCNPEHLNVRGKNILHLIIEYNYGYYQGGKTELIDFVLENTDRKNQRILIKIILIYKDLYI
jgi:hypothetical protein